MQIKLEEERVVRQRALRGGGGKKTATIKAIQIKASISYFIFHILLIKLN
jgi:hypothetical protein